MQVANIEKRTKGMPRYTTRPWAVNGINGIGGGAVFKTKKDAKKYAAWLTLFVNSPFCNRPPCL